jgi:outer membrane lipopolysaccharide assembly protein LptE/RlpB
MLALFQLFIFAFLALCLSSCGFHLRGQVNFPTQLKTLYIDSSQPFGPFLFF